MNKKITKKNKDITTAFKNNLFANKWQLIIIIFLPLIVYFKVINFELTDLDDNKIITYANEIKNFSEIFQRDAFLCKDSTSFYRPVQGASYMLDFTISDKNPWMYHLSNLIIHIATCLALYFFLRFLNIENITSFLLVLVYSVHPLFASAVSWIPSRGDLLLGLFSVFLFMSFGYYFQTGKMIYFVLHALLFLFIVFTKETAVLFPLLLLFYYFFILRSSSSPSNQSNPPKKDQSGTQGSKKNDFNFMKLLPFFIVWIFGLVFYFYSRGMVTNFNFSSAVLGIIPLIKNLPTLPIILGKFFIPVNLSTLPLFDNISLAIGIAVLLIIVYLVMKYTKEKKWMVLLGFAWFLLFTIPPMAYRQKSNEFFYDYLEHRAYMPTIGLILLIAYLLDDLIVINSTRLTISGKVKKMTYILIIVIMTFTYLAYSQSDNYKDPFIFYTSAININPNNSGAYTNRGIEYCNNGDNQSALIDFDKSIEIHESSTAYYNRGYVKAITQDYSSAENDFSKAISFDPLMINAYTWRANVRMKIKDYNGALQDLDKAEKIDPNNTFIFPLKGDVFLYTKNYKDAIQNFTKAILLNPANAIAYQNRGFAKINLNDFTGAIEDCNKAIQIDPNHPEAYNYIGMAYRELSNPDEAIKFFNIAINMSGNFAPAFYERGVAKQKKNDIEGACKDWNEALNLGYSPAKDMLDKFCK